MVDKKSSNLTDAILKSLESFKQGAEYKEVYEEIVNNGYFNLGGSTPETTVSSALGGFIRAGDARVNRVKRNGGSGNFIYYLTKHEDLIRGNVETGDVSEEAQGNIDPKPVGKGGKPKKGAQADDNLFHERDLHKLISTFLKEKSITTFTIKHEESTQGDKSQIWSHPDVVGIKLLSSKNTISQKLQKTLDGSSTFELYSFELKREINSDRQLKEAFFQAVSNSSWANYGYLAFFSFAPWLEEEMARLNDSFGIGFIHINANAPRSKYILTAKRKDELDFKTIEKLCVNNDYFKKFISKVTNIVTASENHFDDSVAGLEAMRKEGDRKDFDIPLGSEAEIKEWCANKKIPWEEPEETPPIGS
jgi:hypothetical protein